jgi:hypothetical protein
MGCRGRRGKYNAKSWVYQKSGYFKDKNKNK